jgi:speckle-type POZ protein
MHTCTLPNFSSLNSAEIKTPVFECAGISDWSLLIRPKNTDDWLSVYLQRPAGLPPVNARATFELIGSGGKVQKRAKFEKKHPFPQPNGGGRGFAKFYLREHLLSLLENDTLVIRIKITVAFSSKDQALKDFGMLLHDGLCSDVTLFVDDMEFPAHRSILSARSPVFKAMFSHEMKESKEGTVDLEDIKSAIFKEVMQYIYTGECKLNCGKENLVHLLAAADRFQLPMLVDMVSKELRRTIAVETVADVLLIADKYSAPKLKKACLEFIQNDPKRMNQIEKTSGYQRLGQSLLQEVVTALTSAISKKRSREDDGTTTLTQDNVKRLKVHELRERLRARGLAISGVKDVLIDRLMKAL